MWNYTRIKVKGEWVLEHRYIMEKYLKRNLLSCEHIHHINGNVKDNRIDNLKLLTISEHNNIHHPKKRIKVKCFYCKKLFPMKNNQYKRNIKKNFKNYCSRSCLYKSLTNYSRDKKIIELFKKGYSGYKISQDTGWNKKSVYLRINKFKKRIK